MEYILLLVAAVLFTAATTPSKRRKSYLASRKQDGIINFMPLCFKGGPAYIRTKKMLEGREHLSFMEGDARIIKIRRADGTLS